MAIHSSTFGSVTLTDDDAKKFKRQVTYGRPKANATEAVARGVAIAKQFRDGRALTVTLPKKPTAK